MWQLFADSGHSTRRKLRWAQNAVSTSSHIILWPLNHQLRFQRVLAIILALITCTICSRPRNRFTTLRLNQSSTVSSRDSTAQSSPKERHPVERRIPWQAPTLKMSSSKALSQGWYARYLPECEREIFSSEILGAFSKVSKITES